MRRLPIVFGALAMSAAVLTSSGYSQDKKDTQPGAKASLPVGWGKLGIVGDQKKKVMDVVTSYTAKINDLKDKIEKLKTEEYAEAYKLLNDDQKAILKKMADTKADPGKDKDKKDK
jgi:hypothetical protein